MKKSLSENAVKTFVKKYKRDPRLFFSPGRINLLGEHIDYNDGFVMPATINKGIWFAIAPNNSDKINLNSIDLDQTYSTLLSEIQPVKGWQDYLLGVIDQVQQKKLTIGGFDCVFGGDLPVGAGLSSSAAVECGLLTALNEIFELGLDRITIAQMGQKAEHTYPKVMCGIMDQFSNMMGKEDTVILLDCMTLEYKYLPLELEDYSLVLINSKVHHDLASGEYNKRRKQCKDGFKILKSHVPGANSFREISSKDVIKNKSALTPVIYNRCLFVTQEIERTQRAAKLLEQGKLPEFGKLMYETHKGLSELYEVSCPEMDFLVAKAKKDPSFAGSRMIGGGFGGCTLNLINRKDWAASVKAITEAYKAKFNIEPEVYEVTTGNGTFEAVA